MRIRLRYLRGESESGQPRQTEGRYDAHLACDDAALFAWGGLLLDGGLLVQQQYGEPLGLQRLGANQRLRGDGPARTAERPGLCHSALARMVRVLRVRQRPPRLRLRPRRYHVFPGLLRCGPARRHVHRLASDERVRGGGAARTAERPGLLDAHPVELVGLLRMRRQGRGVRLRSFGHHVRRSVRVGLSGQRELRATTRERSKVSAPRPALQERGILASQVERDGQRRSAEQAQDHPGFTPGS